MNNTGTLTTSDTQDTGQNKHQSKQKEQHRDTDNIDTQETRQHKHQGIQKEQSRKNNTDTPFTSDTEDTRQNKHQSNQNEQHRDTDNFGYTRHKTK